MPDEEMGLVECMPEDELKGCWLPVVLVLVFVFVFVFVLV